MELSKTDIGTTILSLAATLALWEALLWIFPIPSFIVPAPSVIFVEGITRFPLYLYHSWVTFYEMVVGFVLAAVVGVFLAVVIVYSRVIRNLIYPQIVVLQIVPKVAIAPLLLIWAGYGLTSKVLLALLISFFPIVVNMVTGLVAIEEELLELCRILHSGRWQEFAKVSLPNALPYLFSSLKVASTLSVIGAVIGEFVGGSEGLGHLIIIANTELRTSMSFVALFSLSVLGFLLYGLVVLAERLCMPWEKWQGVAHDARGGPPRTSYGGPNSISGAKPK
jgi:NitT/TauT family transport system permease protein